MNYITRYSWARDKFHQSIKALTKYERPFVFRYGFSVWPSYTDHGLFNRSMEIVIRIRLEFQLHGCTIVRRKKGICSMYMLDVLFGLVTVSHNDGFYKILCWNCQKHIKMYQTKSDILTCLDAKSNFDCHLACQQPRWSWS